MPPVITIHKNGAESTVTFHLPTGDQKVDATPFDNPKQRAAFRELVVDYWCRENGWAEVYGGYK